MYTAVAVRLGAMAAVCGAAYLVPVTPLAARWRSYITVGLGLLFVFLVADVVLPPDIIPAARFPR